MSHAPGSPDIGPTTDHYNAQAAINDEVNNAFTSTYELGKVIGAKEEQIRIIRMVKQMATTEDEIGPFVYLRDFVEYLEENNDKPTH